MRSRRAFVQIANSARPIFSGSPWPSNAELGVLSFRVLSRDAPAGWSLACVVGAAGISAVDVVFGRCAWRFHDRILGAPLSSANSSADYCY
jgi:hypothetical protein